MIKIASSLRLQSPHPPTLPQLVSTAWQRVHRFRAKGVTDSRNPIESKYTQLMVRAFECVRAYVLAGAFARMGRAL